MAPSNLFGGVDLSETHSPPNKFEGATRKILSLTGDATDAAIYSPLRMNIAGHNCYSSRLDLAPTALGDLGFRVDYLAVL